MGFRSRFWVGLQLVVLLGVLSWTNTAVAGRHDRSTVQITVVVNDSAGASRPVLNQAEIEAGRILGAAGFEITWVNCSDGAIVEEACHEVPGSGEFVLHIVHTGHTSTDSVFGMAFLSQDGTGNYCDVFLDRIEKAHREFDSDESELLGTVAAHELGHLLLGSHAHSHVGIMVPVWKEEILRDLTMGHLLFTSDQSSLMKARMRREDVRLVGLRTDVRRF